MAYCEMAILSSAQATSTAPCATAPTMKQMGCSGASTAAYFGSRTSFLEEYDVAVEKGRKGRMSVASTGARKDLWKEEGSALEKRRMRALTNLLAPRGQVVGDGVFDDL